MHLHRGETFRKAFSNIGDARSLIPSGTNMMALTATATKTTRLYVCRRLGMLHPKVISLSPNRENIKYYVTLATVIEDTFAPLVEEIRRERRDLGRLIIFCRTYDDASCINLYIRSRLGPEVTDPIGAPDMARFRLVDLFTACTHSPVKDS